VVRPADTGRGLNKIQTVAAIAVFLATYVVVAIGRMPGLRIDRAGAAFLGGAMMVAVGALTLDEAYAAIDLDTIALLLGMMVLVANLRLAGFFRLVTAWAVGRARHPLVLLIAIVLLSGVLSAFLVNDAICLVLTPLVMQIVQHLRRDPLPYAIAIALAANVGSTATITGNPQNMIIGGLSHIPYGTFAAALSPVAAVGLVLTILLVALRWRHEFAWRARLEAEQVRPHVHRPLIIKTLVVAAGLVVAFFAGVRPAEAALIGGALLLPSRRVDVRKIYGEIDFTLLLMFAGLFVVVAGIERTALTPEVVRKVAALRLDATPVLAVVTAILSNIVSNVPAVLVLRPFVHALPDQQRAWEVIAMASTLAGNFTIPGSVANLIVVQWARAHGVTIGFWRYFSVGAPLTVLTIIAGMLIL
jgi:Na+/H+ antiporter NhaD/arsenite permease-like protein